MKKPVELLLIGVLLILAATFLSQREMAQPAQNSSVAPQPASMGGFDSVTSVVPFRSMSLANSYPSSGTVFPTLGAQWVEKGPRWEMFSNPAPSSQATASKTAVAATRHVADCVSFSGAATTAPALTALQVNLRDGATGAGTVIWTQQLVIGAVTGQVVAPFSICGLNLVGTTNTAMTLEFSALLTNLVESVSISGYDIQ